MAGSAAGRLLAQALNVRRDSADHRFQARDQIERGRQGRCLRELDAQAGALAGAGHRGRGFQLMAEAVQRAEIAAVAGRLDLHESLASGLRKMARKP